MTRAAAPAGRCNRRRQPAGVQTLEQPVAVKRTTRTRERRRRQQHARRGGDTPGRVQALVQPIGGVAAANDSGESDAERLAGAYGYQPARPGPAGGALGGAAVAGKAGSNAAGARSPAQRRRAGRRGGGGARRQPAQQLDERWQPAGDTTMGGATGAVGSGSATLE